MAPQRTRARVIELLKEVAGRIPISSNDFPPDGKGFDYYTGPAASPNWNKDHPDNQINNWKQRFEYDWPRGVITTGCNSFAGQIIKLAGGPSIGGMDLRASLDGAGVPFAWIPANSGKKPQSGDVLDFGGQHIGMTYLTDDSFRHIDGGQGGPGTGYDIIKYGMAPFSAVRGWADVDLMFGSAPPDSTAPAWLAGWWTLTWQGTRYWYFFGGGGFVQYQKVAPASAKQPVSQFQKHDAGTYVMSGEETCTVKWRITGSVEKWTRDSDTKMTGLYNNSETLKATKL